MMKDKYWAKKKYGKMDPTDYEIQRFQTPSGRLIDETEKKAVLDLILQTGIEKVEKFNILDVATGPGRLAFYLEEKLSNTEITGVDINENMLKCARKIAEDNKSKIHFIKGDIYNLPFPDSQFDAVVGLRFSMHLPQIEKVIKEFSRVLKNGGILIFDIFNYQSILQIKLMNSHNNNEKYGFYAIGEITKRAKSYKLEFLGYKGILLFGETLVRKFPYRLLFLLFPLINSPKLIKSFSTKLVLCFRKYE